MRDWQDAVNTIEASGVGADRLKNLSLCKCQRFPIELDCTFVRWKVEAGAHLAADREARVGRSATVTEHGFIARPIGPTGGCRLDRRRPQSSSSLRLRSWLAKLSRFALPRHAAQHGVQLQRRREQVPPKSATVKREDTRPLRSASVRTRPSKQSSACRSLDFLNSWSRPPVSPDSWTQSDDNQIPPRGAVTRSSPRPPRELPSLRPSGCNP